MRYRFRFRSFSFAGANQDEFDLHLVCDINICLTKKKCLTPEAFNGNCNAGYKCFGVFC